MKEILSNDYQTVLSEKRSIDINGTLHEYEKIEIEANDGVIVILASSGGLFFEDHTRINGNSLEFLRGYLENNETAISGAKRESLEELNINKDDIIDTSFIGKVYPDNAFIKQTIYVVLIQLKSSIKNVKLQKNEGVNNLVWYDKQEILEKINNNKISDSFTLSAYMLLLAKKAVTN